MLSKSFGARDDENEDIWTDIPEGADTLPGGLPGGEKDPPCAFSPLDPMRDLEPFAPAAINYQPFTPQVEGEPSMDAMGPAHGDPLGSWTGVPADGDEDPTQDADDL